MAGSVLNELYVLLGFKGDTTKLKDFINSIGEVNLSTVAASVGLGGLYAATQKLMTIGETTALSMEHFATTTGQSAQEMQRWSIVAKSVGLTTQDIQGAVKSLEDSVLRFMYMGEGSPFWVQLGIDPTTTTDSLQLMHKISDALQGMSIAEKRFYLQNLGLSESFLILEKEMRRVGWQTQSLIVPTEEQTDAVMRNYMAWHRVRDEWGTVLTEIAAKLAPAFEGLARFTESVVLFIHQSSEFQSALIAIASAVTILATVMALAGLAAWISGIPQIVWALFIMGIALLQVIKLVERFQDDLIKLSDNPLIRFATAMVMPPELRAGLLARPSLPSFEAAAVASSTTHQNKFEIIINGIGKGAKEIIDELKQRVDDSYSDTSALSSSWQNY